MNLIVGNFLKISWKRAFYRSAGSVLTAERKNHFQNHATYLFTMAKWRNERFHEINWDGKKLVKLCSNFYKVLETLPSKYCESDRIFQLDLQLSQVREMISFFVSKAWKTKGFILEPRFNWQKTSKNDWGCALKCSLWGQNGGQILNPHEILYNISFYPIWASLHDIP